MSNQLVRYNSTVITSDSSNTASTVVERDASKQINASIVDAVAQLKVDAVMDVMGLAVSASATVGVTATFFEVDSTSALVELTLPVVSTVPNRVFILTKIDSSGNAARFKGNGSENIDGANTKSTSTQYATIRVRANAAGTAWYSW